MKTEDLQSLFAWVRKEFFPEWREGDCWRVEFAKLPRATYGYCFRDDRTIQIAEDLSDEDQIKVTLIHEIAYDFCRDESHSTPWKEAIAKAASRARELELSDLAGLLLKESTHDAVADSLRFMAARYPHNPFHTTVTLIAECIGLSRDDVHRICPDAEMTYKQAQAKARRERRR